MIKSSTASFNFRKGCKIIKKGEVYERKIFTTKDGRFKREVFFDGAKVFYAALINQMVLDDKDRLSIFDKNGPYLATKKVGKIVDDAIKESSKETEKHIHAKDESSVQPERKKIPLAVNTYRKEVAAERPPQPKPSVLAGKYTRLKEIDSRLKDQNEAIFESEKKRDKLKKELSGCTGIFKGGRRKELQQEIDRTDIRISNMKKRLSSIVKEYKFDSVQAFYKKFKAAKSEYLAYKTACAEWEKAYGEKVEDTMSIRDRLRQKEQIVEEREAGCIRQGRKIKERGSKEWADGILICPVTS